MAGPRRWGTCVLLVLAGAGCSADRDPEAGPVPFGTATGTSGAGAPPAPTEGPPASGSDVRLDAQVTAFGGGGDLLGCEVITVLGTMYDGGTEVPTVSPSVSFNAELSRSPLSFGDWQQLCVVGFDAQRAVDYEVAGPAGFRRSGTLVVSDAAGPTVFDGGEVAVSSPADGVLTATGGWLTADAPLGAYTVTVRQDGQVASGEVELVPAASRAARRLATDEGSATVLVLGPPDTSIQVGLYEGMRGEAEREVALVRPVGDVALDGRGLGLLTVDLTGLLPGEYCVLVEDDDFRYCPSASVVVD